MQLSPGDKPICFLLFVDVNLPAQTKLAENKLFTRPEMLWAKRYHSSLKKVTTKIHIAIGSNFKVCSKFICNQVQFKRLQCYRKTKKMERPTSLHPEITFWAHFDSWMKNSRLNQFRVSFQSPYQLQHFSLFQSMRGMMPQKLSNLFPNDREDVLR